MKYTFFQDIQIKFIKFLTKFHWQNKRKLTPSDIEALKKKFASDYYIIATRKGNYLTTFFISLGNFMLTKHWGYYSHVLMNLEDEVKSDDDYRFIEATNTGIHYSTFDQVFNEADSVALIKPRSMTVEEWTKALDGSKTYLGRPYDNLFNLQSDNEINCVELVRLAMMKSPNYGTEFAAFEKMIADEKKLTPDMFAQCPDFDIVYVIRR